MNAILKIAQRTVIFHKKRTIFTIICIILSVSIIAITVSISGLLLQSISDTEDDTDRTAAANLCITFAAAAILMSGFSIVTVFSVSNRERIREIGFLLSIGMSQSQRTVMILSETLIYGIIGVSLGTALGFGISSCIYNSISDLLLKTTDAVLVPFTVFFPSVLISMLLGLGTVTISSLLPIIQMRKLSILETVKPNSRINISLKESILSHAAEKLFGKIGVLAGQNYDNNKGKYRAISLALSGGTILFISVQSLFLSPFWYELDERQSIDGVEEIWFLLVYVSALFMAYFVFVFLFCSMGSVWQNIEGRRGEFAMYKSMGMQNSQLRKMVCIECLFFTWHSIWFGLLGSLLGSYAVCNFFRITGVPDFRFHYPIKEFLLFVCLDVVVGILFSLYFCHKVNRVNIIETIKNV